MRLQYVLQTILVGTLLTLAACSDPGVAQLVDESGTVSEWVYHPAPAVDGLASLEDFEAMEEAGALAVPAPAGWDVRVVWGTSPCRTAPTIRLRGTASTISAIEVDYGPQPRGGDCPSSLEIHAVDLRIDPDSAAADAVVSGSD